MNRSHGEEELRVNAGKTKAMICGTSLDLLQKSDFPYHKELLLKEKICYQRKQILSFKRSSNFEKERN